MASGQPATNPRVEADQKQFVREHFHGASENWNDVYLGHDLNAVHIQLRQALVLDFVTRLALPAGARVLEVGCGAGRTTAKLAGEGHCVKAMDFAPNMLSIARQNCRDRGIAGHVSFIAGDAEQLPIGTSTFDLIVQMGVIGYLPKWRSALQELFRALKPGGHLVITCPNKWGLSHLVNPPQLDLGRWKNRLLGTRRAETIPFSLRHAPGQFDRALADTGFEVRSSVSHTYGPFCPFGWEMFTDRVSVRLHTLLQRLADARKVPYLHRLGKHYIVLARKPGSAC